MYRVISLFLCIIPIFLLNTCVVWAEIIPITPENGSVIWEKEGNYWVAHYKWENTDTDTEYIYFLHEWNGTDGAAIGWFLDTRTEKIHGLVPNKIYFWQLYYHPKDTYIPIPGGWKGHTDFISDVFVFGVNKEIPLDIYEEYVLRKTEETVEEEEVEEIEEIEEVVEKKEEVPLKKEVTSEKKTDIPEYIPKVVQKKTEKKVEPSAEFVWDIENGGSVKGVGTKDERVYCKFKYIQGKDIVKKIFCDVPEVRITNSYGYPFSNKFSVILEGTVKRSFYIEVEEYRCRVEFFDPYSWFNCREEFVSKKKVLVFPHLFFSTYQSDLRIPVLSYTQNGDNYTLLSGHFESLEEIVLVQRYRLLNREYGIEEDMKREYRLSLKNIDENKDVGSKPFGFPLEKLVGVTQWYGYTEYQSPHTGIDFGVRRVPIIAVSDGVVVAKGWDSYYGDCLSGGYYVKVRQSNGMYTVYFHLEKISVNTGDSVRKGDVLGVSGNSGYWNCQALGYHLHFETRKSVKMSSHVNPVGYIGVDWNLIPTVGSSMGGENPHPGR